MKAIKTEANKTIDACASATKKAANMVIDKTKGLMHVAGQKLQDGGKRLKSV